MAEATSMVILVRSLETGEHERCHASQLIVNKEGDLTLHGHPVEVVFEQNHAVEHSTEGFTDAEQAAEIIATAIELNGEVALMEPRKIYDRAIVGLTCRPNDHWSHRGTEWVLMYDFSLAVRSLSLHEGVALDSAAEWLSYNAVGSWVGKGTPTFVHSDEN